MNTAFASALMHFVWQGSGIACLLAIAMIFVHSARGRYVLATVALFSMPMVFGLTAWLALPAASEPGAARFLVPWTTVVPDNTALSSPAVPFSWNIVTLWFVGAALVSIYRLTGWLSAQRLRRTGVCTASADWEQRFAILLSRVRLTRPVRLLESALAEVPLTIGFLRPVIILPVGLLAGLPAQHAEVILMHELAHIARWDYLVNLLQSAVEALLFYHPAVWWVSHVMRREREHCCDDFVVSATGDPAMYAKALGSLEQYRVQPPILAVTGGPLMPRIYRLLGYAAPRGASVMPALIFLTIGSAAALLAYHPEPRPVPEPAPAPAPMPIPQDAVPTPRPSPVPQPVAQAAKTPPAPDPVPNTRDDIEARLRRLETPYQKWLNEEVVWIISDEERAAFTTLTTDDERQQFIEQFWLRRDPTPSTEQNEFKQEHYRRIAWANDRFTADIPGWKTDRGMIYVKFGPPDEKESHSPADGAAFPNENWRYRYLDGIGEDVIVEFVDKTGTNEYRLNWDPDALLFRQLLQPRQVPPTQ
jgi:GWxTD domain-containing protein